MTKKTTRSRLSNARREAIISVAWEAFVENGFKETSMSEICSRVGGSKATLYNYFQSKEELFRTVLRQMQDDLYADLKDMPTHQGELREDLIEYGCRLLGIVLSEKYLAIQRLGIEENARIGMVSPEDYDRRRMVTLDPLGQRLQAEMKVGALCLTDPYEAAEVFWNLCSASLFRRMLMTEAPSLSKNEIQQRVERAVSIFLAAYDPNGKADRLA